MSITTLLSNVPNLVKVLSLSAAVGTGGAMALTDAPSPMDTTPIVSSTPTVSAEEIRDLVPEPTFDIASTSEIAEAMANTSLADGVAVEVEDAPAATAIADDCDHERGPRHATGLDRAEARANAHAAGGHARARAAHAANEARRAERGAPGSRGSAEARAERNAERGERSRGDDAPGRATAAGKREGRGRH